MPCVSCHDLDLDDLFSRSDIEEREFGTPLVDIHRSVDTPTSQTCLVCRFLAASRTSYTSTDSDHERWHIRAFDYNNLIADIHTDPFLDQDNLESDQYGLLGTHSSIETDQPYTEGSRTIPCERIALKLVRSYQGDDLDIGFLNPDDMILPANLLLDHKAITARFVQPHSIAWDRFRKGIQDCYSNHDSRCSEPSTRVVLGQPSRLIDCSSRTIIKVPDGAVRPPFAALSYCIGPRKQPFRLSSQTKHGTVPYPPVVQDAMVVVSALGLQYLWVDQFCINQEDKQELTETINSMDAIYAHAELTIISLGASEADGLPGVSNVARKPQATYTSPSGTAYLGTGRSMRTAIGKIKVDDLRVVLSGAPLI